MEIGETWLAPRSIKEEPGERDSRVVWEVGGESTSKEKKGK